MLQKERVMKYLVPSLAIFGLIVTSCATTKSFDTDDVYSVRPSELPIGESTADEVSYASYKTRKEGKANDRMTYSDDRALVNRQNCLDQWRWYNGCGCSYSEWSRFSIYSPYNQSRYRFGSSIGYSNGMSGAHGMSFGMSYGYTNPYYRYPSYGGVYGYNPYGGYGYNPYDGYGPYGGYGYGYGYSPYGNYGPYGVYGYSPYGYNPYGNYGYNPYGYGYGGNTNGWSNSHSSSSNVIRQHRGSSSSTYYPNAGRSTPTNPTNSAIKTATNTAPTYNRNVQDAVRSGDRSTVVKEVGDRATVTRPSRPDINTTPATRVTQPNRDVIAPPTNTGRTITNPVYRQNEPAGRQNENYQITYPDRNRTTTPTNTRVTSPVNRSNSTPGSYERTPAPSREPVRNSTPAREPVRISTPATPSNSGRSSGSTGTTTTPGRR